MHVYDHLKVSIFMSILLASGSKGNCEQHGSYYERLGILSCLEGLISILW